MSNNIEMINGKIYFIDFGGNTQVVGRFKESDACNYYFYDYLHYWNGNETFIFHEKRTYTVKNGISEIRPASKSEKHNLIKNEIENDCI